MALPGGIKHVEELAVEGKRVFVRVDYNVPLEKGTKQDHRRRAHPRDAADARAT